MDSTPLHPFNISQSRGFAPTTKSAVMDSDLISSPTRGPARDFSFAFADSNFSDWLLRIEIVSDSLDESEACQTLADCEATRKRKHSRVGIVEKDAGELSAAGFVANLCMVDETANSDNSNWSDDCSKVLRVEMLHVSSPILAAKSPFFYKLFSNGRIESEQRHVTLRISYSEEAALMELLRFMYSNTLTVTTAPAIMDVLLTADKFKVASCMRHCSRLLRNMPMTPESALLYLDLPSSVLTADAVQQLIDAAKQFLASRYKDISKYQDEIMDFPLAGIEAILSSDDLQVDSEDAVFDFVVKWTRTHYLTQEERRVIISTRLGHYIRFPYMTCWKLMNVLSCTVVGRDFATDAVLDALFFKAEAPHRQRTHAVDESTYTSRRFIERAYKYRPVKVIEFEVPRQRCVVYLDLKRDECSNLFPSGRVCSQVFLLGGQGFLLSVHCFRQYKNVFNRFGLLLRMLEEDSTSLAVDYEFAAISKPTEEYISKYKDNYRFTGRKVAGCRDIFNISWASFMAEDSPYFINGILHLKAELTIKR